MSDRIRLIGVATLTLIAALGTRAVYACTVCYGDSESAVILGAQQATVLMVGLTYFLLGGGVATFLVLKRRASRRQQIEDDGGTSQ